MVDFVITNKTIEDDIVLVKGKGFLDTHTFEKMEEEEKNIPTAPAQRTKIMMMFGMVSTGVMAVV